MAPCASCCRIWYSQVVHDEHAKPTFWECCGRSCRLLSPRGSDSKHSKDDIHGELATSSPPPQPEPQTMSLGTPHLWLLYCCCVQVERPKKMKADCENEGTPVVILPLLLPVLIPHLLPFPSFVHVRGAGRQEQATAAGTPVQARAMVSCGDRHGRRSRSGCPRER